MLLLIKHSADCECALACDRGIENDVDMPRVVYGKRKRIERDKERTSERNITRQFEFVTHQNARQQCRQTISYSMAHRHVQIYLSRGLLRISNALDIVKIALEKLRWQVMSAKCVLLLFVSSAFCATFGVKLACSNVTLSISMHESYFIHKVIQLSAQLVEVSGKITTINASLPHIERGMRERGFSSYYPPSAGTMPCHAV